MRSLLRTTTGYADRCEQREPPPLYIRYVKDKHWITREAVGILSDIVDAVEAAGAWFIRECGRG